MKFFALFCLALTLTLPSPSYGQVTLVDSEGHELQVADTDLDSFETLKEVKKLEENPIIPLSLNISVGLFETLLKFAKKPDVPLPSSHEEFERWIQALNYLQALPALDQVTTAYGEFLKRSPLKGTGTLNEQLHSGLLAVDMLPWVYQPILSDFQEKLLPHIFSKPTEYDPYLEKADTQFEALSLDVHEQNFSILLEEHFKNAYTPQALSLVDPIQKKSLTLASPADSPTLSTVSPTRKFIAHFKEQVWIRSVDLPESKVNYLSGNGTIFFVPFGMAFNSTDSLFAMIGQNQVTFCPREGDLFKCTLLREMPSQFDAQKIWFDSQDRLLVSGKLGQEKFGVFHVTPQSADLLFEVNQIKDHSKFLETKSATVLQSLRRFTNQHRLLEISDRHSLTLINHQVLLQTAERTRIIRGGVLSASYSPELGIVATHHYNQTTTLWDEKTGQRLYTIHEKQYNLNRDDEIFSMSLKLKFSSDGKHLLLIDPKAKMISFHFPEDFLLVRKAMNGSLSRQSAAKLLMEYKTFDARTKNKGPESL